MTVDHLIYAVRDLDAAAARIEDEHGLASVAGGHHPAWGTENRIVPLGDAYLELVAVADPEVASRNAFGRAVAGRDGLVGWAVATEDIDAEAGRLELDVARGSRTRPDGTTLAWRLAGVERALETGALPFFIEWDGPPEAHPGRAPAAHRVRPLGIASVEVVAPEASVRAWLGEHDLPLRVVDGAFALASAAIATDAGEAVLR